MRTYVPKGREAEALTVGKDWFVVDAEGQVLGRLATRIARLLIGKDKASFTPSLDCGDHVVVINAERVRLTGNKIDQKIYRHHSGYPGGLEGNSDSPADAEASRRSNPRGGARDAAEEQAPRTPRQEVARLRREGSACPPRRTEAPAACAVRTTDGKNSGIVRCADESADDAIQAVIKEGER